MKRPQVITSTEEKNTVLNALLDTLLLEQGKISDYDALYENRCNVFQALCNMREPNPLSNEFLHLQDSFLWTQTVEKGIVVVENFDYQDNIALWKGDITRLDADAIVNACNSALLGCFQPLHRCIDNAIHSAAGIQVRLDCYEIMKGAHEPNGQVKVTDAYNLPSKYIFHTVGPIVSNAQPSKDNVKDLKSCYLSCLEEARSKNLLSIAFCCLSTGVFGYPNEEACDIAVDTVKEWQKETNSNLKIIFNVFLDKDKDLYERKLS